MQFLWKMNYKFQTALRIEFWNTNRVAYFFMAFYLKKRYPGSGCGIESQNKGRVEEHIFGCHLHKSKNLKGWEWLQVGTGRN